MLLWSTRDGMRDASALFAAIYTMSTLQGLKRALSLNV